MYACSGIVLSVVYSYIFRGLEYLHIGLQCVYSYYARQLQVYMYLMYSKLCVGREKPNERTARQGC